MVQIDNSDILAKIQQAMARVPMAGGVKKESMMKEKDSFQKLLDQKSQTSQSGKADSQTRQTEGKEESAAPVEKGEETPIQKEDPLERAKKLAEQGYVLTQPGVGTVRIDLKTGEPLGTYEAGEYILAVKDGQTEIIPTAGMEPWQKMQLQQLMDGMGRMQTAADASDPEADALLEATDPTVEHGPAQLLEKLADQVAGTEKKAEPELFQTEEADADGKVEVTDAETAPQALFEDVKAAPIKVGETYRPEQSEAPDVSAQISSQLTQAMAQGQSRVEIRLTPENLGTVKVELVQGQDGVLHIAISAENSQTRNLLERHAGNLQAMLADRGQTAVQVEVQRQEESQRRQENPYDGHNGQQNQQQDRRQHRQEHDSRDFIQQLRLGLIPVDGEDL